MGDGRGRGEREEEGEEREEGGEGSRGEGKELVEGMEGWGEAYGEELGTRCETRGGRNISGGSRTNFSTLLQTPEVGFHLRPTGAHLLDQMLWILVNFNYHLLLLQNYKLVKATNKTINKLASSVDAIDISIKF